MLIGDWGLGPIPNRNEIYFYIKNNMLVIYIYYFIILKIKTKNDGR